MELHGFFRSSASHRLRIALALKGIAHAARFVSLPGMEHRGADYLAINPQGLVPALVVEGRPLTQSLAIMEYLEETHPEPPILPAGPLERAHVRALAQIIACDIHPLNNLRVLKYLQGPLGLDDAARDTWYRHWIAEGMTAFETMLTRAGTSGRFCHGDTAGMADICLVPQIFNARRFDCPLDGYPTSMAIFERCMALPAFEATQPSRQPDAS